MRMTTPGLAGVLKNNIPLDSTRHDVDVAIIGGGPAGAAAALTLLSYSSLSVAVVERSNYSAWRVGETLPPSVLPLLQYLGLSERFAAQVHLPAHGTSAAWGGPEIIARDFLFTGRGQGWHLDRVHFDRTLAQLVVERGGFLLTESVVTNELREQGSWRLLVRDRNMPASIGLVARFVIDASGKGATFARRQGARRSVQDRLMGLVGIYELKAGSLRDTFTLVESCPIGWWYSALLPDARMVIAFMSDIDIIRQYRMYQLPRWHELVQSSQHIKQRLVGGVLKSPPVLCPAFSQSLDTIAGDGWVATGEAAICFDPLSSMGIGYALISGIHAARAVHNALMDSGRQMSHYTTDVKQHFFNYMDRKRQYYLIEQRWPNWPFWLRRHQKSRSDT
jgi:flavin-dependent dehydrogenase